MPSYAELVVATAFSFLRGASHAGELVTRAAELGIAALGIADRNTVAGVVRAHAAARELGSGAPRILPGARLVFADATPDLVLLPKDRAAWGRLTALLSRGKARGHEGPHKSGCRLFLADLEAAAQDQAAILIPPADLLSTDRTFDPKPFRDLFGKNLSLAAIRHWREDDARRLRHLAGFGIPMLATGDILMHAPERRPLADVLACIRENKTLEKAGFLLAAHAERHLKPPDEMVRLFSAFPEAIERTMQVAASCRFALDQLAYEYPDEPVPLGRTADAHLADLAREGASKRWPLGVPAKIVALMQKELSVIAELGYAPYFLTVHDIVSFARSRGILCQGRGSAANSAVCYALGITAVDPTQIDLLFERFISAERREPPDIDIDFEHERREEVIQYIYNRYGYDRAAIAATVIHFRSRRAAREVGKVMGLSEDTTAALAAESWNHGDVAWPDERLAAIGLDPASPTLALTVALAREIIGFPRHLSQHVGGFVLTRDILSELVPIGPAAMAGRFFIEWDKDDIDALGIMKVDVLALGMLSCIRRALSMLLARGLTLDDLAAIPQDDPLVYAMLSRGDSVGVFQVESRAQMNMLPRLAPRCYYDLVIEVAIVRPGPIQGDMVHPYLRRRQGLESIEYPAPDPAHGSSDELERVLGRTLGVPLFQEQAMRIAIEAARFTPEEANRLRRSMATFRNLGTIRAFHDKMVEGMVARGYARDFAERCFHQIEGFGTYGFPESHAASFALLVYVSAWIKCHHPAVFAAALLNAQPMGFYAPAQIVRDAREHGVVVLDVDAQTSSWDCAVDAAGCLRLGFRLIAGFRQEWAEQLVAARGAGFADFASLARSVPRAALLALGEADALASLAAARREALWSALGWGAEDPPAECMLLPANRTSPAALRLPAPPAAESVIEDYGSMGLSLRAHPLGFLRAGLAAEHVVTCAQAAVAPDGAFVAVSGLVLVRQRPGSAGGVVFATLEDESGIVNVVIWPDVSARYRAALLGSQVLRAEGHIQRWQGTDGSAVVHLVATRLLDESQALARLDARPGRGDELPRSRDFR
ncbi:MAG: error-prone DNA polymerase [Rhodospirillales bacterium]|nr:error-prone DNA polymerase [Rhodospirillales bacterium]